MSGSRIVKETPLAAAKKAREIQLNPMSTATVFDVDGDWYDSDYGRVVYVDGDWYDED